MAKPLDLEEQQQLDALKAFWAQWGNFITWLLIAVFGTIAAYNGYLIWKQRIAQQASGLYEQVELAAQQGDLAKLTQAIDAMKQGYASATLTHQAALLAAQQFSNKGDSKRAQAELQWVASNAADEGLQAVASLRLSALHLDAKSYDEAARILAGSFPEPFRALVANQRGDMALLQGKPDEAKEQFLLAYRTMSDQVDYKRLVAAKLESLGVEPPKAGASAAAGTASAAEGRSATSAAASAAETAASVPIAAAASAAPAASR